MKLDKTKVYSLEGMNKKQVEMFFNENGIDLPYDILFIGFNLATYRDLIRHRTQWEWYMSNFKLDIVKVIDLIK